MLALESIFGSTMIYDIKAISLNGLMNCWALALGLMIVSINSRNKTAYRFLSLFLFIEGLRMLTYYLFFRGFPELLEYLVPFMGLRVLSAPILYLFCRSLTLTHFTVRPVYLLHALPFLAVALLTQNISMPPDKGLIYSIACIASLSYMVYAFLGLNVIKRHEDKVTDYYSSIESISLSWLRSFCIYFALLGLLHFIFASIAFFSKSEHLGHYTLFTLSSGLIFGYLITFFCIYKAPRAKGLCMDNITTPSNELATDESTIQSNYVATENLTKMVGNAGENINTPQTNLPKCNDAKYSATGLERDQAEAVYKEIKMLMSDKRLYLDNDLKLAGLADQTGLPLAHVSQAINQVGGCNFYEFVNTFRVEAAVNIMRANKEGNINISNIIEQAGFSSTPTFYRNFKKHMGVSPKEFAKQIKQNNSV